MFFFPFHQTINSVLTISTCRQHQIPQLKCTVPQDCPAPELQRPTESPGCPLCFRPMPCNSGAPRTSSLGPINMLEWLTEFHLLDCQFVIKQCNSGTARWKRSIGQGMGKGMKLPCLSRSATLPKPPCVHQPGSSLKHNHLGVLWRLHGLGMIDWVTGHWLWNSLELGGGTESSNHLLGVSNLQPNTKS